MAVGERERRELQEALVGTIGPGSTDTLLGYLPPVGWADVATKRDLDALESRLDSKMDLLAARLEGQLHAQLHRQDRWLFGITITIVLALFTQVLALLAPRFLG
jgi:hypothetical protein